MSEHSPSSPSSPNSPSDFSSHSPKPPIDGLDAHTQDLQDILGADSVKFSEDISPAYEQPLTDQNGSPVPQNNGEDESVSSLDSTEDSPEQPDPIAMLLKKIDDIHTQSAAENERRAESDDELHQLLRKGMAMKEAERNEQRAIEEQRRKMMEAQSVAEAKADERFREQLHERAVRQANNVLYAQDQREMRVMPKNKQKNLANTAYEKDVTELRNTKKAFIEYIKDTDADKTPLQELETTNLEFLVPLKGFYIQNYPGYRITKSKDIDKIKTKLNGGKPVYKDRKVTLVEYMSGKDDTSTSREKYVVLEPIKTGPLSSNSSASDSWFDRLRKNSKSSEPEPTTTTAWVLPGTSSVTKYPDDRWKGSKYVGAANEDIYAVRTDILIDSEGRDWGKSYLAYGTQQKTRGVILGTDNVLEEMLRSAKDGNVYSYAGRDYFRASVAKEGEALREKSAKEGKEISEDDYKRVQLAKERVNAMESSADRVYRAVEEMKKLILQSRMNNK